MYWTYPCSYSSVKTFVDRGKFMNILSHSMVQQPGHDVFIREKTLANLPEFHCLRKMDTFPLKLMFR